MCSLVAEVSVKWVLSIPATPTPVPPVVTTLGRSNEIVFVSSMSFTLIMRTSRCRRAWLNANEPDPLKWVALAG